jgi:DNA-directed RNA polymerase subunit beta
MNKIFIPNVTDLIEHQRASYYEFLYKGIEEEFLLLPNPILLTINIPTRLKKTLVNYYFHPNEISIAGPNYTYGYALYNNLTYAIQIYIQASYTYPFIFTKDFYPIFKSIFKILKSKTSSNLDKKKNLKLLKKFHPLFYYSKEYIGQNFKNFWLSLSKDLTKIFHSYFIYRKTILKNQEMPFREIKKIWIKHKTLIGEIPLMTDDGTFLVTGCERIVISQIIKNSGVYFQKTFCPRLGIKYSANIISDEGSWTKFTLMTNLEIYQLKLEDELKKTKNKKIVKILKTALKNLENLKIEEIDFIFLEFFQSDDLNLEGSKISIYEFLQWFGLSEDEIQDNLQYKTYFKTEEYIKQKDFTNKIDFTENYSPFFYDSRKGYFFIGKKTRYYLNQKFNLRIPENFPYLSIFDFLAIIDGLIELKYFDRISDDIDHIENKHVRAVGDFLKLQIKVALSDNDIEDIFNIKKPKISNLSMSSNFLLETRPDSDSSMLDPRYITGLVKSFFKTSPLSQFMDQVNPLSEVGHKRKISTFGPNGLDRDHISTKIRDIHPSQYGRLCCIESPEGQNSGLISSLALYAKVGQYGFLESPYFELDSGSFNSLKPIVYLNPVEESKLQVGFSNLILDNEKNNINEFISVKNNYNFLIKKKFDINFLFISPLQILSLAAGLVPFIEHDDANRALMGANMQRQAVPLLIPEKAIVGTGLESVAILESKSTVKSLTEGIVFLATSTFLEILDTNNQKILYQLIKYRCSNQDVAINQRSIVWPGEKIYFGQIIADGPGTLDGELSLGKNLLVAYMPWEGFNFEDSVVLNEDLVINDSLTSIHIQELETTLSMDDLDIFEIEEIETFESFLNINEVEPLLQKDFVKKKVNKKQKISKTIAKQQKEDIFFAFDRDIDYLSLKESFGARYSKRNLSPSGIIKIGAYVQKNDILIAKFILPSVLMSYEILQQNFHDLLYGYPMTIKRDNSFRLPEGNEGRVLDIRCIFERPDPLLEADECDDPKLIILISIGQILKIELGDKVAGRHGNKGVISKILPKQDMPYLPDGTIIDIMLNPLGVPSRMNIGQLFECILGFTGANLGKHFRIFPFDEIYGKEASRVLIHQKIKEVALKSKISWISNLNILGKIYLRDGRTGEYFDNSITVGRSYILKLIHLVEEKVHGRAIGPYTLITEQPLAGKSQEGGQRFGEMEVWALEAYGCSNMLQELLTVKSDDIDARTDLHQVLIGKSLNQLPNLSFSEGFLLLIRELNTLGFDLKFYAININVNSSIHIITQSIDIFTLLEKRLKLRNFLEEQISQLEELNTTFKTSPVHSKSKKQIKKVKIKQKKK